MHSSFDFDIRHDKTRIIPNYKELLESNLVTYGLMVFDDNLLYDAKTKLFNNGEHVLNLGYYTDLKYGVDYTIESDSLKLQEWNYLYEGLIRTIPAKKAIEILNRFFKNCAIKAFIVNKPFDNISTDIIEIDLFKDDYFNEDNKDTLNNISIILNNLGYRYSHKRERNIENELYMSLIYDPEFLEDFTNEVYEKYNGILYHITSIEAYDKILKNGLIPRHIVKEGYNIYSDRVYFYFYNGKDKQYLIDKAKDLMMKHNWKDYVILKIDLNAIYKSNRKYTTYRFFEDPYSLDGVFTYENIDPRCIEKI